MKKLLFVFITLIYSTFTFASQTPAQELSDKLKQIQTIQADFKQVIYNMNNHVIGENHGTMIMVRPNKFYWQVISPISRLIVANGKTFWIYNQSLKQVIVRAQDQNAEMTPALLLSSNATDLTRAFHVSLQEGRYVLQAHSDKTLFQMIALKFSGNAISQIEMQDNLGQRGKLQFSSIKINKPVSKRLFVFAVPRGVDVIRQ
ncbi:MAG: outer membrane lipoprotein chaperone LolA [Gammaproteobacteria bacterium]